MKNYKVYEICETIFSYENGVHYRKLFEYKPEIKDSGEVNGVFEKVNGPSEKINTKIRLMAGN